MKKAMILVFVLILMSFVSAGSGGYGWGYGYTSTCAGVEGTICQYSCSGYDDFYSEALDTNKWEIRQDVEGQPFTEEYWVDTNLSNFHIQQKTIGDRRTYLFPKRTFTTGNILEYDFDVLNKSGNAFQMDILTGAQYTRIGIDGYEDNELGTWHVKLEFQENNLYIERKRPSGIILRDNLHLTNANGTYELYLGAGSGHNGIIHIDFDNFALCTKQEITLPQCGDTITEDTIMTEDLINCAESGLIIGADNITLDCDGHLIDGTDVFSTGISMINRHNVVIQNCNVRDFHSAVRLEGSDNNIFKGNILKSNQQGFSVLYSSNNLFEENEASSNMWGGFSVNGNDNSLMNNIANNNKMAGIEIKGSRNLITNNFLTGNRKGISVTRSQYDFEVQIENNTISYNNFSGYGDTTGVSLGGCSSYPCYNSKIIFKNNDVIGNYIGISYVNGFCADELENNNIKSNLQYNLIIPYKASLTGYNCNANWERNWWGTDIKEEIELKILGETKFIPFLCSPSPTEFISDEIGICIQDSDGDGVQDSEDKCPNTEGEQIVYGCSCEQILALKPGNNKGEVKKRVFSRNNKCFHKTNWLG